MAGNRYDREFAERLGGAFGEYERTFETEDVRVDLFRQGELIRAYVAATGRRSATEAVEPLLLDLTAYVRASGQADGPYLVFT